MINRKGELVMAEKTSGSINQADELQSQLNQTFKQLDEIRNTRQSWDTNIQPHKSNSCVIYRT